MSEVIAFLESLGCMSSPQTEADHAQAIALFAPDVRDALCRRDLAELVHVLGGRPFMACSVFAPDSDEPMTEEQPVTPEDAPGEEEVRAA